MHVERDKINGSVVVSDIIANRRVTKVYYGYTKKEAERLFKRQFKARVENDKQNAKRG